MTEPGEIVTCPTCGGKYMPVQKDGGAYVHACPDGKVVVKTPAVAAVLDPVTQAVLSPAKAEALGFLRFATGQIEDIVP